MEIVLYIIVGLVAARILLPILWSFIKWLKLDVIVIGIWRFLTWPFRQFGKLFQRRPTATRPSVQQSRHPQLEKLTAKEKRVKRAIERFTIDAKEAEEEFVHANVRRNDLVEEVEKLEAKRRRLIHEIEQETSQAETKRKKNNEEWHKHQQIHQRMEAVLKKLDEF